MSTSLVVAGTALTIYDVLVEVAVNVIDDFIEWLFDDQGDPIIVNGQHAYQVTNQQIYDMVMFNLQYVYDADNPLYAHVTPAEWVEYIVITENNYNEDIAAGIVPVRDLNFYADTDAEFAQYRSLAVQKENAAANTNTSGIFMYSIGVTAPFAMLFAFNSILSWFKKTFLKLKGRNSNVGFDS